MERFLEVDAEELTCKEVDAKELACKKVDAIELACKKVEIWAVQKLSKKPKDLGVQAKALPEERQREEEKGKERRKGRKGQREGKDKGKRVYDRKVVGVAIVGKSEGFG